MAVGCVEFVRRGGASGLEVRAGCQLLLGCCHEGCSLCQSTAPCSLVTSTGGEALEAMLGGTPSSGNRLLTRRTQTMQR